MRDWTKITMIMRNFFRRNGDKEREEKYQRLKDNESNMDIEPSDKELYEFKNKVRCHTMVRYPLKDFGVNYRKSSISGMKKKVRHVHLPGSDIPEGQEHYESCRCGSSLTYENGHNLLCLGGVEVDRKPSHNDSIRRSQVKREVPICPTEFYREAFYYRAALFNRPVPSSDSRIVRPVRAELLDGQRKRSPIFQSPESLPTKFSRVEISPNPQCDGHGGVNQPDGTCSQFCCRFPEQ